MRDDLMPRSDLLHHALRIAESYNEQGLTLTLRQLYYRFVAEALFGSGQDNYKRLGSVLTDARYTGDFPIQWIEDRGRTVGHTSATRGFRASMLALAETEARAMQQALPDLLIDSDPWLYQPTYVSVWVEKEALAGVFEAPCAELGVGLFACRGYPSVSALYDWLRSAYFAVHGRHPTPEHRLEHQRRYRLGEHFRWTETHEGGQAKECVVLYFGDHDPDGWQIPRSAESSLELLMNNYGMDVPLRFERIALNMDQILKYKPPPFEAKVSSARYKGYLSEHCTDDAWELDALEPGVLQQLIRDNVARFWDQDVHEENKQLVRQLRSDLRERLRKDPA